MTYLTTKQVLDKFFSRVRDNSAALRVKSLGWLNSLMTDVVNERPWLFLDKSASLAITANQITLPVDFGLESSIQIGTYFLTSNDRFTPEDAFTVDQAAGGVVTGYTIEADTITFHPSATGTAVLHYTAQMPATDYTDGTDATLFPVEFIPLFERSLLTAFYEYDVDSERLPIGLAVDRAQMKRMKSLDNSRKALPKVNRNGYIRDLN